MSPPKASDGRPLPTPASLRIYLPVTLWRELEQASHSLDYEAAESQDEQHTQRTDDHPDQGEDGIVEQNSKADQDDSQRRERVKAGERGARNAVRLNASTTAP